MARPPCRYCVVIRGHAARYPHRIAVHDLESAVPRCDWHWRFLCSVCGRGRHFHAVSFCPVEEKLFCIGCAPRHRAVPGPFWGWSYSYRLRCPWRKEWHAALDRLEFDGRHPWQTHRDWARRRFGSDPARTAPSFWSFRVGPPGQVSDREIRKRWDEFAEWWVSRYSPRGDVNREWIIDPVLLAFLGEVRGRRVLDAGCGGGYLARILVRRGARVDGVDVSAKLLDHARAEEERDPRGIRYHRADLANLSRFRNGTFDACVSNVVLQDVRRYRQAVREVFRVLKPGGRFVFSLTHPAFEAPVPGSWLVEPVDSDRIEDRKFLRVDRYFDRVTVYWGPPEKGPVPSFHRPLRDYFEALSDAGFVVARYEEPTPSNRALDQNFRAFADLLRVPLFVVVEAVRPRDAAAVRRPGRTSRRTPRARDSSGRSPGSGPGRSP